jgi:glutaminyl-tRNA synthetase
MGAEDAGAAVAVNAPAVAVVPNTTTSAAAAADDDDGYRGAALSARELEWAVNPPELLQQHRAANSNGGIVRTRFPPEPNGFLHIGHAKSMNMNFRLAFEKLGVPVERRRTIFRYDDTNPDAETVEYIDSLRQDCAWLGWVPEATTYSSDNFDKLYRFALQLIRKGLAYVCDMSPQEMKAQRELAMKRVNAVATGRDPDPEAPIPSPDLLPGRNRDTSVERNLELFDKMKLGMCTEGSCTLRLKMDFSSPNPNLHDLVAYRIKYTAHPHAGRGWCIYPSYDFTHGICDSLEHIDYSICTLEFEARREPYYWILWALDLYRPKVYEMSRLNLEYVVLSKRKLIQLVNGGFVRGWDDCRMPTISGLRRRGYTATILNQFCTDVGATRAANVVEMNKLHQTARLILAPTAVRAMAALDPVRVVLTNFASAAGAEPTMTFQVSNIATDESKGFHDVTMTDVIYIDSNDFRMEDSKDYYGLAPGKAVGLKCYGGNMICDNMVTDTKTGKIQELHCHLDNAEGRPKPKSFISWVPSDGVEAEVRVYNHLFTVPEPTDLWQDELNPESEVVYQKALIDASVKNILIGAEIGKWVSNPAVQFERLGYFVVDYETTYDPTTGQDRLVFNRTVSLKQDIPVSNDNTSSTKNAKEAAAAAARADATKAALAAKEERMKIAPADFFRLADEYKDKFSKYDDEGIPTHDNDGTEVTKSMMKKLIKEQKKHVKQLAAWNK